MGPYGEQQKGAEGGRPRQVAALLKLLKTILIMRGAACPSNLIKIVCIKAPHKFVDSKLLNDFLIFHLCPEGRPANLPGQPRAGDRSANSRSDPSSLIYSLIKEFPARLKGLAPRPSGSFPKAQRAA
jgi:hypothetical protein